MITFFTKVRWVKGHSRDGKEEGLWEEFHENGQLKSRGNFKDGKQDGFWEKFNRTGQVDRDKDGELVEENLNP